MLERRASVITLGLVASACACGGRSEGELTQPLPLAARPAPSDAASSAATAQIASLAPGRALPNFLWTNPSGALTRAPSAAQRTPEGAARAHLAEYARYYGLDAAQTRQLELRDVHDPGRGAVIARFGRRVDGVEVFGEQIAVAMDRNLDPVALSGYVSSDAAAGSGAAKLGSASAPMDPAGAVVAAIADVTGIRLDPSELGEPTVASGQYRRLELRASAGLKLGATGSTPPRVKPVLYPASVGQLLPAYYVEVDLGHGPDQKPRAFAFVIGAGSKLLWKKSLTAFEDPYTYRVYADDSGLFTPWDGPQGTSPTPHPTGLLDRYQAPFVASNLVTLSSLHAVGVDDPWLPPGATTTLGNNVDAYVDLGPPNGFTPRTDFRGTVTSPGVFDHLFEPELDATSRGQRLAALTQVFYTINWLHDWFYAAGFTEASGNAQFSNYARGGLEGDALRAEGQDGSGWNNANMNTPADGGQPTMQLYLQDFGAGHVIVSDPPELVRDLTAGSASFTPLHFDVQGVVVRADPVAACARLAGDYSDAIVLADAGGCDPVTKARNAAVAGASGIIIANLPAPGSQFIQEPFYPDQLAIAVLTVNSADGDALRAALAAGQRPEAHLLRDSVLRDNDVDNQTMAHEWGHYISNRLIGDATGLDTNMASGLGEGWGDFHALLLTVRAEDADNPTNADWEGVYAPFGYTSNTDMPDPYYFGIRRYPYSTDMSKNPLTFGHISEALPLPVGVPNAGDHTHYEAHATGEVWATMLWECYASLLRDTRGPGARLTFAEARDRMRDDLVAAYKLTPRSPTLLEARDALLTAALLNDPIDHDRFVQAFAKRGAGVFAEAPDRGDPKNQGVIEDYGFGAAVIVKSAVLDDELAPVCAADGYLDDGETGRLRLAVENLGSAATAGVSALVSTPTPGLTLPSGGSVTIPPLPIHGTAEVIVPVAAQGLRGITALAFSVQVSDAGAGAPPSRSFEFVGNVEQLAQESFSDGAESSHVVWTSVASVPSLPASAGWQRTAQSTLEHAYGCRSAGVAATIDFVSPPLRVSPGEPLSLSFRHRFSFEKDAFAFYDGGVLEVSRDGGSTWEDIGAGLGYTGDIFANSGNPLAGRAAFVGESANYPAFAPATVTIAPSQASTLLVRFRVASDAGVGSPGWEVDDISVAGVLDPPFDAVIAQPQSCNNPQLPALGPDQLVDRVDGGAAPTTVLPADAGTTPVVSQ